MTHSISSQTLRTTADPLLERVSAPYACALYALGLPIEFRSNRRWLVKLAEEAYAGLPAADLPGADARNAAPLLVRLIANNDLSANAFDSPPTPFFYSDGATVAVIMSQADAGLCALQVGKGLVTVSPAMAKFPYNVRYELIEFVTCRLAVHQLRAVGLHAACIARGDTSLILFGESGAGKSTLVFASLSAGWDLIAEDGLLVLPHMGCQLRGAPNFIHLMDDALDLLESDQHRTHIVGRRIMRRSGRSKLEIDARAFTATPRVEVSLGSLIFIAPPLNHATMPRLHPLKRDQVRQRIIAQQPFAARQLDWSAVLDALLNCPAYALRHGAHVRDSVDLLSQLV
jgi:hypothetical protein